jgi:Tfp pilus assembly protein PilP
MSRPHISDYRTDFWVSISGLSQLAALICGTLLLFFYNCAAAAEQSTVEQPVPIAKPGEVPFEYSMENRPDPFVPFITEKAAASKVDMNEIIESNEPLTGMQLFEPGQLTLVALLKKGKDAFAMVEDFTGRGYVLNEGMKIGRRGVVKDIRTNEVLIEETAVTRAGKKITTETVMVLKNEKEE